MVHFARQATRYTNIIDVHLYNYVLQAFALCCFCCPLLIVMHCRARHQRCHAEGRAALFSPHPGAQQEAKAAFAWPLRMRGDHLRPLWHAGGRGSFE